ncbi:hypothetical protein GQ54DRAFT_305224 [Martensiomyces pterosporus]|nr:hypothetical protein GQ54DRAFT_305224 [Martensiomyces pterosporus]
MSKSCSNSFRGLDTEALDGKVWMSKEVEELFEVKQGREEKLGCSSSLFLAELRELRPVHSTSAFDSETSGSQLRTKLPVGSSSLVPLLGTVRLRCCPAAMLNVPGAGS